MKNGFKRQMTFLKCLFLISIATTETSAEGSKQFLPNSSSYGCIQVNDVGRPFALMTNTDPLHRLYFHIANTSERVYFGFSRHSTSVASSGQYQIKNPSGTIVAGPSNIPNGGAGKISNYTEAVAGPKISGSPANGYSPLSYTPVTTGDFYIEFSSDNNDNYRFEYFDLTVVNSSNVPIDGRVWSYAWDINTWASSNGFSGSFYVYTSEGYVSRVNMNGIQAYGFVTSCNGTGPQNTGDLVIDRRSIAGNSTRPDFKVFLNNPDINVYPSANAPSITNPVQIVGGNIYYGQPVQFTVGVSAPGTMQFIISINGVSGYQAGTTDVLVVANVVAGMNTIDWDGKDASGNYPAAGTVIEISTGFSAGITHLPIYDPETHPSGFIVDRIRPGSGSAPIRWDDINFASGTVNISGGSGNGHLWSSNFGDVRTMNTWWNGYEVENADLFTVTVQSPLPVSLTSFTAEVNTASNTVLSWTTNSESNLDYFVIEKSHAFGTSFLPIGEVSAFGNSTTIRFYSFVDEQTLSGNSYYRLRSVNFDGNMVYESKIEMVSIKNTLNDFDIFPNPASGEIAISNLPSGINDVEIFNALGEKICDIETAPGGTNTPINVSLWQKGVYFVKVSSGEKSVMKKLVRM
jgi:hypothetical protein